MKAERCRLQFIKPAVMQSWRWDALDMALGNYLVLSWHFVYALSHIVRRKLGLISEWLGHFQFDRIALCGDVHPQPGPAAEVKYPRKECQSNVRSNQNVILCANCETWSHAKCLGFTDTQFKRYFDNPHIDWICGWFCLPFNNPSDLAFGAELSVSNDFEISAIIQDREGEYANTLPTD